MEHSKPRLMRSGHTGQIIGVIAQETSRSARGLVEFLEVLEDQELLSPDRH